MICGFEDTPTTINPELCDSFPLFPGVLTFCQSITSKLCVCVGIKYMLNQYIHNRYILDLVDSTILLLKLLVLTFVPIIPLQRL